MFYLLISHTFIVICNPEAGFRYFAFRDQWTTKIIQMKKESGLNMIMCVLL